MDNYELENEEKIYPLFQIEKNGKNYLFYSKKEKDLTSEDIYVGEEVGDELLPVSDEILKELDDEYQAIFEELK